MICIGLVVFAGVVTPRMSVDTFPELTPPVLIIGTLCPASAPKDVEKTISLAPREVRERDAGRRPRRERLAQRLQHHLRVAQVGHRPQRGADAGAVAGGFAMAAVPKSLGVLPPFVLQYDPSNAPVVQVVVTGEGYTGPQLYDYAFNYIEPLLEGISGVASAAPTAGGCGRSTSSSTPSRRRRARHARTSPAPSRARTRSCRRASSSRRTSTRTSTRTRPEARQDHRRRAVKVVGGQGRPHQGRRRVDETAAPPPRSRSPSTARTRST
jgi:hypothetical protein